MKIEDTHLCACVGARACVRMCNWHVCLEVLGMHVFMLSLMLMILIGEEYTRVSKLG